MGGRGNWSATNDTFTPNPSGGSGGGSGDQDNVLGPRIPENLAEALGPKGKPMTPSAASAGTNPHYSPSYDAYSSNCQRCVLAYEARRRGYDVTALPTYKGDLLPYSNDYLKSLSNPKPVSVGKSTKKLKAEMQQYGEGARAIVKVTKGHNGHVFIAENQRGKVIFIDPQTNERYNNLSLSRVSQAQVIRLDDQQFTEYARNAFTRQKV